MIILIFCFTSQEWIHDIKAIVQKSVCKCIMLADDFRNIMKLSCETEY